jgi:hypothetical protein
MPNVQFRANGTIARGYLAVPRRAPGSGDDRATGAVGRR